MKMTYTLTANSSMIDTATTCSATSSTIYSSSSTDYGANYWDRYFSGSTGGTTDKIYSASSTDYGANNWETYFSGSRGGTADNYVDIPTHNNYFVLPPYLFSSVPIKQAEMRARLRQNLVINIRRRGDSIDTHSIPEQKALETFREMVTEKDFKKYLRYGFVLVPGKSGATYQIFRNSWHTKVWKGGKLIEEV